MIRRLVLLHLEHDDTAKIEWHKDQGTRQLIVAALTPDEIEELDQTLFGRWAWLQQRMESKILAASRRVISGEEFGTALLEQARLIQQRAAELQARNKIV